MIETKGTSANLKNETRDNPHGGLSMGSIEAAGTKAPIKLEPIAPSAAWDKRGGTIDMVSASKAPLDDTPRKGWEGRADDTTFSKRAKAASK